MVEYRIGLAAHFGGRKENLVILSKFHLFSAFVAGHRVSFYSTAIGGTNWAAGVISAIEREDSSGHNYNLRFSDGRTLFVRTID